MSYVHGVLQLTRQFKFDAGQLVGQPSFGARQLSLGAIQLSLCAIQLSLGASQLSLGVGQLLHQGIFGRGEVVLELFVSLLGFKFQQQKSCLHLHEKRNPVNTYSMTCT
jgi:hypothetical protein